MGRPIVKLPKRTLLAENHQFLADRTNARAYASTLLRPSVVCITYVLWLNGASSQTKISLKKQIENGLWGIEWSRDR